MTNELYHYGVPGMRWGKRKAVYPVANNNPRARQRSVRQEMRAERKRAKAETKEINKYAKKMFKTGLAGSEADMHSKGKSTALYNTLMKTKGKEFTDKVIKATTQRIDRARGRYDND